MTLASLTPPVHRLPAATLLPALILVLLLSACATPTPVNPLPEGDFKARMQTQEADDIRVSAAVPSREETRSIFANDLYKKGIQPVWLEIENHRQSPVTFLPVGLDPAYYTPNEVASLNQKDAAPQALIGNLFANQGIRLAVQPGESRAGFMFTRLDEGTKVFNVDLAGRGAGDFTTFTFFVPVPGLAIDHYNVDWENLYPPEEFLDLDDEQLMRAVEDFACCVTDKDGKNQGDPLNLVIIGRPRDVYTAFIRAGWDETESVTRASAWKTFRSFVGGGEYRYSPVSNLYAFGRPQDVAFQKARENIHERNHLRLWMSPARYHGLPVWLGQISRDIGVRFTAKTITTHKIDPDVDETREFLLEDLAYAQSLARIGYLGGVGAVPVDQPRGNLTGDPWYSDGYRLVLWVSSEPTPLSRLEALPWRNPHAAQE